MDKSKNHYCSHVQIPKLLLKAYRYKTKDGYMVDYWDLQDNLIKTEKYKKLNAEFMYFTPSVEQFLDMNVESRFAEVVDNIRKWIKTGTDNLKLKVSDVEAVLDFFKFTYLRNKELFFSIKENSTVLRHTKNFSHSYILEKSPSSINHFFDGKRIYLFCNKTNKGFIGTHNVLYYIFYKNINSYLTVMSISPKLAIGLSMEEVSDDGIVIPIKKEQLITSFNQAAYLTEIAHQEPYLFGNKVDLEEIRSNCSILSNDVEVELVFDKINKP